MNQKLYTKTGDKGRTSLRMDIRISKDDCLVEAYGTIDELNSAIGITIAQLSANLLAKQSEAFHEMDSLALSELSHIQSDLMHISAILAGEKKNLKSRLNYLSSRTSQLEQEIDKIQAQLPKQTQFYLPGGSKVSAHLDYIRTICRRAERRLITANTSERNLLKYINRLSDYLYALARLVNKKEGIEEKVWNSTIKK